MEIEKTEVSATTIHNLFDFNSEYVSKLDFAKVTHAKVAALSRLQVLLLDEVSMVDYVSFNSICKVLSDIDHCRRPDAAVDSDFLGSIHIVLFGDLKQPRPRQRAKRHSLCSRQFKALIVECFDRTDESSKIRAGSRSLTHFTRCLRISPTVDRAMRCGGSSWTHMFAEQLFAARRMLISRGVRPCLPRGDTATNGTGPSSVV